MNKELIINMFYAAPELWYILGGFFVVLFLIIFSLNLKILKLKQKNYFINRDRERYAETLYASKDGYLAFIYPDSKVNDPMKIIKERCSRRLAVLLNLEKGQASTFEDILKCFYRDDAKKIVKYYELLKEEGVPFDGNFVCKNDNRHIRLSGCKIMDKNGNIFCDMIWFRDVTDGVLKISELEEEKEEFFKKIMQLEDLINNIPYPVWLRDNNLDIIIANKKYYDFLDKKTKNLTLNYKNLEIYDTNGESISKNLALAAVLGNKAKSGKVNIITDGQINTYEVTENPFYSELTLDKISSVGSLINVTELEEMKLNHKLNQNTLLEVLGTLGNTAFVVLDKNLKISFYNVSFEKMWKLEDVWLKSNPNFVNFLDVIREKRLLPEVPSFSDYKNDEIKALSNLIEPKEDLLHLPDGRTIRRVSANYPSSGSVILAFEDVSDRLASQRAYNSLISLQQDLINHIYDALLIFDASGKLKSYNQQYINLWQADKNFLETEPNILDIIDSQKNLLNVEKDWEEVKKDILHHITNFSKNDLIIKNINNITIEAHSYTLSDGSTMIIYHTKS